MTFEEFVWRTVVLAAVNGVVMWLAITLFDFGNARNTLVAAILWSILLSVLVHVGFLLRRHLRREPFGFLALVILYAVLLKWYDLEIGQTIKVAVITLGADVGAYIALTKMGILPPFETAAIIWRPLLL